MPSSLIPTLRYRNAPAAIDFLCHAFGFRRHMVDQHCGGRLHACRDPEGHLPGLGDHDPWAEVDDAD